MREMWRKYHSLPHQDIYCEKTSVFLSQGKIQKGRN